ncbi:putative bifunctional diguanylate cyclase/phosphodiesterase [Bacillus sp. DJP31]|uniref:putative bifunctional diguanylate cyclase/phosphodiesterase n=1 Tax=Bacillus sp. DJP31 TaxID=3409789 RepID=UPI003BB557A0
MKNNKKTALIFMFTFTFVNYLWSISYEYIEEIYYIGGFGLHILATLVSFWWLFSCFKRTNGPSRFFWFFLSLGCLSYLSAITLWSYYEFILKIEVISDINIPDLLWIGQNCFYLFALVVLMYVHKSKLLTLRIFFDILIVMLVATAFNWKLIINPILTQSTDLKIFPELLYPILDLGVLFGTLSILIASNTIFNRKSTTFLILGLLIQIIGDTLFSYQKVSQSYLIGGLSEQLWILSLLFIGLSAVYHDGTATFKPKNKSQKKSAIIFRHSITYTSFALLFIVVIFQSYNQKVDSIIFFFFICMMLIVIRQILTLIENDTLVNKFKNLNDQLELKVKKRTEQLEESLSNLEYMAYHDMLTNLPNRRMFERKLSKFIRVMKPDSKLAIMLIDLDRFKHINDSLGHSFGDKLLNELSQRLVHSLGKNVTIARIGGDEFSILIEHKGIDSTEDVARTILIETGKTFEIEGIEVHVTPSIGISLYPDNGNDFESLLMYADTAMYYVKEKGKNNFAFYDDFMENHSRIELENSLRKAIEKEEFKLHLQPQVSVDTGEIIGAEALIRWEKPLVGFVSPQQFIPIAEETGLINLISSWVIKSTCKQLVYWKSKGLPLVKVAVNISSKDFQQPNFIQIISDIVEETGVDTHYLELEITERIAMDDFESVFEKLTSLRSMGIKIAMDDFGTGYSSLRYLSQFPIDCLKIDRSFISAIQESEKDAAIVRLITLMAKALHLNVLAEGVETESQLQFLKEIGCEHYQGFIFSRPLSIEDFEKLVYKTELIRL